MVGGSESGKAHLLDAGALFEGRGRRVWLLDSRRRVQGFLEHREALELDRDVLQTFIVRNEVGWPEM